MGTPVFAEYILEQLIIANHNVILVVTQPDKPAGRKRKITKSPVKFLAEKYNIAVFQPQNIKLDNKTITSLEADLIITAAYGQIIPQVVLDSPKLKAINVHGSLLPKYRGGAPIHYAVLNGDIETGISIIEMKLKMDAGPIIMQQSMPIMINDTTSNVHDQLKVIGAKLLLMTIQKFINNEVNYIEQNESIATFSPNIKRTEEEID